MKALAEIQVIPIGAGVSVRKEVMRAHRLIEESGLKVQLHSYGTNVEGEWDTVMAAVKRCHEVVHEMGAPRISTTLRVGTRTDRDQTMDDKVTSVEEKLREGAPR